MGEYKYLRSFASDRQLSDRLFDLIEACFPGMTQEAERIRQLGASWESASTPFIYFQDGLAISHVGVLEIPLEISGQMVIAGGIHGVCTRPEYRRQGYYRQVMAEVLNYCDSRYQTLILTTPNPNYYQPFGFRSIPEYFFTVQCHSLGTENGWRLLDLQASADLQLLHALLGKRQTVSQILGVGTERAVFLFNEGSRQLYYAEKLDAIASMEIIGDRLHLFDLVAPNMPSLAAILHLVPQPIKEANIYFTPDRLQVSAQATPHILDGAQLMARGQFNDAGKQVMLPRSARC